jgi:4-oxalocrotonate tautomerase
MPIVSISMISGRTAEQRSELIRAVAVAVSTSIEAPVESIRVILTEIASENWGVGAETAKSKGR